MLSNAKAFPKSYSRLVTGKVGPVLPCISRYRSAAGGPSRGLEPHSSSFRNISRLVESAP
jgi:hypothetical protein